MITVDKAIVSTACHNCDSRKERYEIGVGKDCRSQIIVVLCEGCLAELGILIDKALC